MLPYTYTPYFINTKSKIQRHSERLLLGHSVLNFFFRNKHCLAFFKANAFKQTLLQPFLKIFPHKR